jgi:hypothetical protein
MAALMNLLGAFLGTGVAQTVGSGIVELPEATASLVVVLAALLGAISWNLITWWFGLPSSSSHALIGGLIGPRWRQWARQMGRGGREVRPMVVSSSCLIAYCSDGDPLFPAPTCRVNRGSDRPDVQRRCDALGHGADSRRPRSSPPSSWGPPPPRSHGGHRWRRRHWQPVRAPAGGGSAHASAPIVHLDLP